MFGGILFLSNITFRRMLYSIIILTDDGGNDNNSVI